MNSKQQLFTNLFDSPGIIPDRLNNFGEYVKEALVKLPDSATYADMAEAIGVAIEKMSDDSTNINVNLIEQKDDTGTVKTFASNFAQYMRDSEMTIGAAMGGAQSAGFKAFYPAGITEYVRVTRAKMKTLTNRVKSVTEKYGKALPAEMQDTLKTFAEGWQSMRGKQQGQMSTVKVDRTLHSAAYINLQMVLTRAVHFVAYNNPGNEELGNQVFPFHMLYKQSQPHHTEITGTLQVNEARNLMNRRLSTRVYLLVENKENNSDLCLWQDATGTGTPPVSAVVVKAGDTKKIGAGRLGSLAYTFLMIANMSDVNTGQYKITVSGLPKDKKPKSEKGKTGDKKMKVTAA